MKVLPLHSFHTNKDFTPLYTKIIIGMPFNVQNLHIMKMIVDGLLDFGPTSLEHCCLKVVHIMAIGLTN